MKEVIAAGIKLPMNYISADFQKGSGVSYKHHHYLGWNKPRFALHIPVIVSKNGAILRNNDLRPVFSFNFHLQANKNSNNGKNAKNERECRMVSETTCPHVFLMFSSEIKNKPKERYNKHYLYNSANRKVLKSDLVKSTQPEEYTNFSDFLITYFNVLIEKRCAMDCYSKYPIDTKVKANQILDTRNLLWKTGLSV